MSALPRAMQRHMRAIAEVRAEIEYLDRIWPVVEAAAELQVGAGESPTFLTKGQRAMAVAKICFETKQTLRSVEKRTSTESVGVSEQRIMRSYLEVIAA